MDVFVTGATGFIGRRLCQRLIAKGHFVRCLVRPNSDLSPLQYLSVELWRGDVNDPASLEGALEGIQAVIHLVGIIRERPPQATFQHVHVEGTRNLLAAAQEAGVPHCLYLSAIGARPSPQYPYLHSKWEAEELVRQSDLPWTVVRPSIVFGQGDEFLTKLAALVRHPPAGDRTLAPFVPIIGSGKTRFQPIWVEDLAECLALTTGNPALQGQTVTLGGPEQVSYEDMIDLIMNTLPLHRPKLHLPVALMRPAVALMPIIYKDPPITSTQLNMINLDSITDIDAVQRTYGFQPASLRDKTGYLSSAAP